jgi:hypothetical protein
MVNNDAVLGESAARNHSARMASASARAKGREASAYRPSWPGGAAATMNKMSRSIQRGSRRGGGSTSEQICVEVDPTTPSALAAVASRHLFPERSLPLLAREGRWDGRRGRDPAPPGLEGRYADASRHSVNTMSGKEIKHDCVPHFRRPGSIQHLKNCFGELLYFRP